jgi:DNA-binding transcriptional MocR family regulator
MEDFLSHLRHQTIGHDKVNQLRHVRFFGDIAGLVEHMRRHADIIRPKFEAVEEIFDRELSELGIGSWTKPLGGYFIMFDSLPGCAKDIVARAKKAGVILTSAGATWPYGKDPNDSNIRIAPTFPSPEELQSAMDVFTLCVRIASAKKLLAEKQA